MKNKSYKVPIEIPLDLYSIIDLFNEEALSHPEEFAKIMVEFGHNGDWTLEYEYLKRLKKDIKAEFGNEAAKHVQAILDIMNIPNNE